MWKRIRKFIKRRFLSDSKPEDSQMLLWALFFAAALLTYGALLVRHGFHLWRRDYFQFFPVFVAGVVYLTVQRFRAGALPPKNVWRIEPASMVVGLAIIPIALWITSPWTAAVSFWLVGNSLLCGNRQARQAWRLLAVLIPLPLDRDHRLIQMLQQVSSEKASVLLDAFNVPHRMRGNVLELADRHFFVEEACSGISSVYLMLATTWFCLVWYQTRAVRGVPLLLSVFWWAVVANIVRIFSIAAAHHFWQLDLSTGLFHELTGVGVLLFAFGMVFLTMQFLDFLFDPIGDGSVLQDNKVSLELTPTVLWNLFTVRDLIVAHGTRPRPPLGLNIQRKHLLYSLSIFLLLSFTANLGFAWLPTVLESISSPDSAAKRRSALGEGTLDSLPTNVFDNLTGVSRLAFKAENEQGGAPATGADNATASHEWTLKAEMGEVRVSVEGPYAGWTNVRSDYEQQGWKVVDSRTSQIQPTDFNNLTSLQMMSSSGQSATLYVCHFSSSGQLMEIPGDGITGSLIGSFRDRLDADLTDEGANVWQFQMFVIQSGHVMDAQVNADTAFFELLLWKALKTWRQSL